MTLLSTVSYDVFSASSVFSPVCSPGEEGKLRSYVIFPPLLFSCNEQQIFLLGHLSLSNQNALGL